MAREQSSKVDRARDKRHEDWKAKYGGESPDYGDMSPEEIEADIRQTRAEMDRTLEELQHRLSPRNIWEDVVGMFRKKKAKRAGPEQHDGGAGETAKKIGRRVLQTVRDHPVPAVLMTTAVTTLIYESASRRSSRSRDIRSINIYRGEPTMYGGSHVHAQSGEPYYGQTGQHRGQQKFEFEGEQSGEQKPIHRAGERMREMGSQVGEHMSHAGESVRGGIQRTGEAMRSGTHKVREGASHMGEQVKHGMQSTREFIEERPLTVGIGAVALGLLAGLLIPRTQREDRFMGEQSQQFIERTREMGEEVAERGKHVAEEAMEAATEAASEESERQGLKPD